MELLSYQDRLIQTARALKSMLQVDIIIVDKWLKQLVNTFPYQHPPIDVQTNSVVGRVIIAGKAVVVEDRKASPECLSCPDFKDCEIQGIIGVPILDDQECVGVIAALIPSGCIHTSEGEGCYSRLLPLLEQAAGWITDMLQNAEKGKLLSSYRQRVINSFDLVPTPVALTDEDGGLIFCNDAFCEFFNIEKSPSAFESLRLERILLDGQVNPAPEEEGIREGMFFFDAAYGLIQLAKIQDVRLGIQKSEKMYAYVFEQVVVRNYQLKGDFSDQIPESFGPSSEMQNAKYDMLIAAHNSLPVTIEGRDMVQTQYLARLLYSASSSEGEPYFEVDCTLRVKEIEDTLFGDGAHAPGFLGLPRGGTLCLLSINYLPLHIQERLSCAIQEQQSTGKYRIPVRLFATSRENLRELADCGKFSKQLLGQLSRNHIYIPEIKSCWDDVVYYMRKFVNGYEDVYQYPHNSIPLDDSLWTMLKQNRDTLDYAGLRRIAGVRVAYQENAYHLKVLEPAGGPDVPAATNEAILREMLKSGMSKMEIARNLGISRATLYRWISKFDLKEYTQERKNEQ